MPYDGSTRAVDSEMGEQMRRRIALVMVTGLALVALGFGTTAHADPATVVDDFFCQIIPADSGLAVTLTTTETSHVVETASGNVNFTCHFDIPAGMEPTATMHHEGFGCTTQFGATTDTWSVTTKGGKVLLRCQIRA
jgi:hypothetical protein